MTVFEKDELYQHVKSKALYSCVRTKPETVLRSTRMVGTKVVRNPDPKKYRLVERVELSTGCLIP